MPPRELLLPRLEALLLCREAVHDDGGTFNLRDVANVVFTFTQPPCRIQHVVYVRYATSFHQHVAHLRIVEVATGKIVDAYASDSTVGNDLGVMQDAIPVTFLIQRLGLYMLEFLVNDQLIGTSLFRIEGFST